MEREDAYPLSVAHPGDHRLVAPNGRVRRKKGGSLMIGTFRNCTLATTSFAALLSAGLGVEAASAQEADTTARRDTIVVTASKRAEDIQDVAMSVSAVSGDYLEEAGIANVAELARSIPSVSITQSNNNRNSTVFIRGIGTSGTNPGIEQSVGIFIDGVYILAAGPIQGNLQDVNAIEVLRGPQGTLYGRNTPVGAVNITTRAPTQESESGLTIGLGNYADKRISGYFGGGLTEDLAGRVSVWYSDRDGYEHNLYDGEEVNGQSQAGFRGRLQWKPTETLTGDFIAYMSRIDANCCTADQINPQASTGIATSGFLSAAQAIGRPFRNFTSGDHVVDDDYEGDNVTDVYGASAAFNLDLSDGHTLTSITAYNGYKDDIRRLAADGLPQATATGGQNMRSEGWSEEIRIASPVDQPISYIAGVYLFSQSLTYTTTFTADIHANRRLPPAPGRAFSVGDNSTFFYSQKTRSAALFGQATWNVTDDFRLTAGARYSYDEKDGFLVARVKPGSSAAFRTVFPDNPVGALARDETKPNYSFGVQYDLNDDILLYAMAATGYKTGGFNARSAAVGTPVEFEAENSDTVELGVKSVLLGGDLVLNADVYRMNLKDFQDSTLNPLTGTGFIVANAGDRRVEGFEAEAQFYPIDPLSIRASLGLMDAKFTDYSAGQCYAGKTANGTKPGTCNYNGLTPAFSPELTWSIAGEWKESFGDTGADWFVNADASHISERNLDTTLDPRSLQEKYTLLGARAGFAAKDGSWRVAAYGKNLTDEGYFVVASPQPIAAFVSAGGLAGAQGFVGWYGPPRTYGVEATFRF
jgi:iron complex outermembrane receptor protein